MSNFVHLHLHTEYSLLDGAARIKKLVKTAKEMGMPAVAMTDHGNMYGAVTFYNECKSKGIKAIIGCEIYITDDMTYRGGKPNHSHLLLLAKNNVGYNNLAKINSIAFVEGMYYKPRIDFATLEKYSEGLVVLSGCLGSPIPKAILSREFDKAEQLVEWFKKIWKDDFYLEMQNHGMPEQLEVNQKLREYAKKYDIKLVATNDVHYINKDDSELQEVLVCIQTGKTLDDPSRMKFFSNEFYLKSYDEMLELFPNEPQVLETTLEIAEKCDVSFEFGVYKFPKFEGIPDGKTPEEYLRELVLQGLEKKYKVVTQEHLDRFESELTVIKKQGFVEYFLIVWDFINEARKMDVPVGPGRGSGAGSIIAYALSITNIDPLKYDLLFERFLHGERVSAPDFDIDFSDEGRDRVIEYVRQKYGEERVARIVTFGTMAGKSALKDVARVLKMPYSQADRLTKAIPNTIKGPMIIKKAFGLHHPDPDDRDQTIYGIPELIEAYNASIEVKRVVDLAVKIEDMPRQTGIHACGVVIGAQRLDNFLPLSKNGEDVATQFTYAQIEVLGHLKMDFLGLRNLNDIKKTIEYVKENHGVEIDFDNMGVDDPEVYKLISSGNTKAMFQIESGGFQRFMKDLKPTSIEDIIAGVSLYRPGPMDTIPRYVHNKHNPKDIKYHHPLLEPILKVTYGSIVYQEQVMRIVQDLAGYTLGQADNVRRMMGKKKVEDMAREKNVFIYGKPAENGKPAIDGAVKRGVDVESAEKIWSEMESFATYAFNKSHAAAYSYITYQTAYLKRYYEPELLTAILNNRIDKVEEITNYVSHAREEGIKVLPPDINKSQTMFSVKDNEIRFGLAALKGVGVSVIDLVIKERNQNGDFIDFADFVKRFDNTVLNKRTLESLILSGAFDCFSVYRSQLMRVYPTLVERNQLDKKSLASGQFSLFDTLLKEDNVNKIQYPNIEEFDNQIKLKFEKEVVGVYVSGHPLENYKPLLDNFSLKSTMLQAVDKDEMMQLEDEIESNVQEYGVSDGMDINCGGIVAEVRKLFTKRDNKEMAFVKLEDLYGTIDVMFYSATWLKFKELVAEDALIYIEGKVNIREGESPVIIPRKVEKLVVNNVGNGVSSEPEKQKKLYLKYDLLDPFKSHEIMSILKSYEGDTPVVVKCTSQQKAFQLDVKVNHNSFIVNELHAYLPDDCIVLK